MKGLRRAAILAILLPVMADSSPQAQLKLAKFQHDQLRCTKLADVSACDDALRTRPDDPQLTVAMGRSDPALDAFIAADVLEQDDQSVALAIVALTDTTRRKDALALAARPSRCRRSSKPRRAPPHCRASGLSWPARNGHLARRPGARPASRCQERPGPGRDHSQTGFP